MALGEFIRVIRNTDICIMTSCNDESGHRVIYDGESRFFRISDNEEDMRILYITPHRENVRKLFIMVEE